MNQTKTFKAREIVKMLPGLVRSDLIWWESQGFITPQKTLKNRLFTREYSEDDFNLIKRIWKFCNRGFKPAEAFRKAMEETEVPFTYKGFALSSPQFNSLMVGSRINAKRINEIANSIERIILNYAPTLIIIVSSLVSIAVGFAFSRRSLENSKIPIVPVERSDRNLLNATIRYSKPEDKVLIFHDGNPEIVTVLREIRNMNLIVKISEVNINDL